MLFLDGLDKPKDICRDATKLLNWSKFNAGNANINKVLQAPIDRLQSEYDEINLQLQEKQAQLDDVYVELSSSEEIFSGHNYEETLDNNDQVQELESEIAKLAEELSSVQAELNAEKENCEKLKEGFPQLKTCQAQKLVITTPITSSFTFVNMAKNAFKEYIDAIMNKIELSGWNVEHPDGTFVNVPSKYIYTERVTEQEFVETHKSTILSEEGITEKIKPVYLQMGGIWITDAEPHVPENSQGLWTRATETYINMSIPAIASQERI
jgi:hypothetical protein